MSKEGRVILSCGHEWDGVEAWDDMMVILPDSGIDYEAGHFVRAYSTGMQCAACRAGLGPGGSFASVEEAEAWLRADD